MIRVLVIDDAEVDRKLTSMLLKKNPDYELLTCESAERGLELVQSFEPHLVITDLVMPGMDGFELIRSVRKKFSIPVIAITSRGSENSAEDALKEGAASYCSKSRLAKDLMKITKNVLAISLKRMQTEEILTHVTRANFCLSIGNNTDLIPMTVDYIQSHLMAWDDTDRMRIGVSLDEALRNAMHHGNLEVDSVLRELEGDSQYKEEIEKRAQQAPYKDRFVEVDTHVSSDLFKVRIKDEGPGFSISEVQDPTHSDNLEKPCGRGLMLINTFMTEVFHNDAGNQITMIKQRED